MCASIPGISADCVEIGNHFRGNLKQRRLKVLAKMLDGRCSGDDQDIGRSQMFQRVRLRCVPLKEKIQPAQLSREEKFPLSSPSSTRFTQRNE